MRIGPKLTNFMMCPAKPPTPSRYCVRRNTGVYAMDISGPPPLAERSFKSLRGLANFSSPNLAEEPDPGHTACS